MSFLFQKNRPIASINSNVYYFGNYTLTATSAVVEVGYIIASATQRNCLIKQQNISYAVVVVDVYNITHRSDDKTAVLNRFVQMTRTVHTVINLCYHILYYYYYYYYMYEHYERCNSSASGFQTVRPITRPPLRDSDHYDYDDDDDDDLSSD